MTPRVDPSILPPIDRDAEAHSRRVHAHLAARIAAAGGRLGFAVFMREALYAPGLGYYAAGAAKLGPGGDFTTAPELSRLFGRAVARQCAEVLGAVGGGILEFGAGSGALACELLATLATLGVCPEDYAILEVSPDLRARQQARVAGLAPALATRVRWLDRLPEVPRAGVVLANEVLDALPVERFVLRASGPHVLGVALDAAGAFVDCEWPADATMARDLASRLGDSTTARPNGYRGEYCPSLGPWIASVAPLLDRGVVLAIDYGLPRSQLYHPERATGTLRAHYRHRAHHDPYVHPGLQDLTAWVDFTAVAEAAVDAGLDVLGFTTQAAFLLALGIERDVADSQDERTRIVRAGEAQRLLLPDEMGESYKVIALGRGVAAPLAGFSLQDLRRSL
jgi:SAM-dependent MidA family methyltransferase